MAAAGLVLAGHPSAQQLARLQALQLAAKLKTREVHADPAEALNLIHEGNQPVVVLDVRGETDYNLFHLLDARRAVLSEMKRGVPQDLPENAVKFVMSNDEAGAEEAWRLLTAQGVHNVYVVAGGVNLWLRVFRDGVKDAQPRVGGDDRLAYEFTAALGSRYPYARPELAVVAGRVYKGKVKLTEARQRVSGCG